MAEEERDDEAVVEIPHDPFNESVVIAAAMVDPETRRELVQTLKPDQFHGDGHAQIWTAISECDRRGLDCTVATVRQVGGEDVDEDYLEQIVQTEVPPNLKHHVETLQWDHARVEAVRGPLKAMMKSLKDPTTPPERIHALAQQLPLAFEGYSSRQHMHDPNQLIREQMADIRLRRTRAIYPYGIDGLDKSEDGKWRIVPGTSPGTITVVTACSGAGKSTLTARIALQQARKRRKVLYGAWEMSGGVTLELLATMSLKWGRYKVATGDLSDDEMLMLEDRMRAISAYVRFVKLPFGRTPRKRWDNDEALDAIHGFVAESACDVAIFDLWKRGLRDDKPSEEEAALYRMQTIADETKAHFILCQQQRLKDIEKRNDKRPTREGIKGTSAWVDVADTILGVHMPSLWKNIPDDTIEIDILKQRYGKWPIAVEFDWDSDLATFENGREVEYNETDDDDSTFGDWVKGEKLTRKKKK